MIERLFSASRKLVSLEQSATRESRPELTLRSGRALELLDTVALEPLNWNLKSSDSTSSYSLTLWLCSNLFTTIITWNYHYCCATHSLSCIFFLLFYKLYFTEFFERLHLVVFVFNFGRQGTVRYLPLLQRDRQRRHLKALLWITTKTSGRWQQQPKLAALSLRPQIKQRLWPNHNTSLCKTPGRFYHIEKAYWFDVVVVSLKKYPLISSSCSAALGGSPCWNPSIINVRTTRWTCCRNVDDMQVWIV